MQQTGYRGRVRTGCLTCRSRKVKCDESRPECHNCTRLERDCVYPPRRPPRRARPAADPENHLPSSRSPDESSAADQSPCRPVVAQEPSIAPRDSHTSPAASSSRHGASPEDPFQYPDRSIVDVTARLERALDSERRRGAHLTPDEPPEDTDSPASLISRDIELTTTMDLLAACGEPSQMTSFFLESVDCPGITPFDSVNWRFAKHHMVELGKSCTVIASAITAVATLFKGHAYGLPLSRSLSLYNSAKAAHEELVSDHARDFGHCLLVVFILAVFDVAYAGDGIPAFKEPSKMFLNRLGVWSQHTDSHSELSVRLVTWLKILQTITTRGGGMGLLSEAVSSLLPSYDGSSLPGLRPPPGYQPDLSTHLYQVLCGPLFDFYFRLQLISGEIAQLTHYHRSRTTGVDQAEVVEVVARIKSRLHDLWESRSATQRQTPKDLQEQLAPKLANTFISLVGICNAAYHTEFVEMDRVLGDPVSTAADSRESIQAIRQIVDNEDTEAEEGLNPGYLRPLFLVAIECMDKELNRWAVDRIAQIRDPIYRSKFFSEFARELSDAELRKERRVTSKYFCIWYFGVPPPYM